MEHQQEDMSSSIRGRRGVRRGVYIAAGLLSVTALGYSFVSAPHSTAADDSAAYSCDISSGMATVAHEKGEEQEDGTFAPGFYELKVTDVGLSGDDSCMSLADAAFPVEDDRAESDGTSTKCTMTIKDVTDGSKFEKANGTITANLDDGTAVLKLKAQTTRDSDQGARSADITANLTGLKGKCEAGGIAKSTIKVAEKSTVKFGAKKTT
ncbi:hypothetical protein [Nocardia colli]|uniref:hypothetical protein n=1 Tax=Nocardia colli TaxID=2545717 RepID=UPI0035E39FA2